MDKLTGSTEQAIAEIKPLKAKSSIPPKSFVSGEDVIWAQHAPEEPSFLNKHKRKNVKGRRQQGINYEVKVQNYIEEVITKKVEENMSALFAFNYIRSPWLVYKKESENTNFIRYCQPD